MTIEETKISLLNAVNEAIKGNEGYKAKEFAEAYALLSGAECNEKYNEASIKAGKDE